MTSYALVSRATGLVQTFLRPDLPEGYAPPEGYRLVPDDQLPEGWQREPAVPAEVPHTVRTAQLVQWLIDRDLLAAVETKLNNPAAWPDEKTRLKALARYQREPNTNRHDPLVEALGKDLGLDAAAMDAAFVTISQYP